MQNIATCLFTKFFSCIFENNAKDIIANANELRRGEMQMSREALDRFKMEAASEVGVNLSNGYNGDLTSKQAGSVGGQMVKKMIESYEKNMK